MERLLTFPADEGHVAFYPSDVRYIETTSAKETAINLKSGGVLFSTKPADEVAKAVNETVFGGGA